MPQISDLRYDYFIYIMCVRELYWSYIDDERITLSSSRSDVASADLVTLIHVIIQGYSWIATHRR